MKSISNVFWIIENIKLFYKNHLIILRRYDTLSIVARRIIQYVVFGESKFFVNLQKILVFIIIGSCVMIERNIFISDCEAKENFPKEVDLATVQVDQFSQLLIEQDFEMTELNAGIIVKYCISTERLNKFVEMGLDICHPEAALMALGNKNYEVAKYVLEKYNVFKTIWTPRLSSIRKYFENFENLSVFVRLLYEFDEFDEFGFWRFADSLWKNYPCNIEYDLSVKNIDRFVYELTALLVSGATWPSEMKAFSCGCKYLRLALKFQEENNFAKKSIDNWTQPGTFISILFDEFSGYGKDSELIPCVKLLMILDLLTVYKFPQSSAISIKENITHLMQMPDTEFLNLVKWSDNSLTKENIRHFSVDKSRWTNIYNFIAGNESDNLLLLEIQNSFPDFKKLETMLKAYNGFPEFIYRHKCQRVFRNEELFELFCKYGMDLSRTFGGYSCLHFCFPFLETSNKFWYLSKKSVEKILQKAPINHPGPRNRPPLYYAMALVSDKKDHTVVEDLLRAGASWDIPLYDTNTTFLHMAESLTLIKCIVEAGADVNVRNKLGQTPVLTHSYNADIIIYLLEHGADIHAVDNKGQGIFHFFMATLGFNCDITELEKNIDLFHSKGCEINLQDKKGNTPLHILVEHVVSRTSSDRSYSNQKIIDIGRQVIKKCIEKGASLDIKNNNNETAVEYYERLKSERGEIL